jgi:hypothetical protein
MRDRKRILDNIEVLYKENFEAAKARGDRERMVRLDFDYQRDQLYLEVMLDLRELLLPAPAEEDPAAGVSSMLEKAQKIRKLTRLTGF